MHRMLVTKAMVVWLLIVVLAIINGVFRESMLVPMMGMYRALPLSGVMLSVLVLACCHVFQSWMGYTTIRESFLVGGLWLVMTLVFEFLFGHYVAQKSWAEILQVFDISTGNLFILVLIICFIGPWLMLNIKKHFQMSQ